MSSITDIMHPPILSHRAFVQPAFNILRAIQHHATAGADEFRSPTLRAPLFKRVHGNPVLLRDIARFKQDLSSTRMYAIIPLSHRHAITYMRLRISMSSARQNDLQTTAILSKGTTALAETGDFAGRLTELMRRRGYNKTELANAAGINQTTMSRWLNRKEAPRLDNLSLAAHNLTISIDWLLARSRTIAGISIDRIEFLLGEIERNHQWSTFDVSRKLTKLKGLYVSLEADAPKSKTVITRMP